MSLTFIRRPSATPTVESKDDVRIFRRLYAGQNGYIKDYGTECSATVGTAMLTINKGEIVLQGWESIIGASGYIISIDTIATKRYYLAYYKVNRATETVSIEAIYDLSATPDLPASDDLTVDETGTAYMALYSFEAENGVITNVTKLVEPIAELPHEEGTYANMTVGNAVKGLSNADGSFETIGKATNSADDALKIGTNIIEQKQLVWNTTATTTLSGNDMSIDVTLTGVQFASGYAYEFYGSMKDPSYPDYYFVLRIFYNGEGETAVIAPLMIDAGARTGHKLTNITLGNNLGNGIVTAGSIDPDYEYRTGSIFTITKVYKIIE